MIEIKNLSKHYGNLHAVENLDLEVRPGEIFGFLGPNGAGKTTTIRCMMGILKATSGQVLLGGHDVVVHRHLHRALLRDHLLEEIEHFAGLERAVVGGVVDSGNRLLEVLFRLGHTIHLH